MIRVFLVQNNPGLPSTLEEHGMEVVGSSVEREQILSLAQNARPDVVLFDGALAWPDCSGAQMVDQLRRRGIRAIFVLVATPNEEHFFQFLRAGAIAYELDTIESSDLARKMQRVAAGEYLLDGAVLRQPTKRYQKPIPSAEPAEAGPTKAPEISTLPEEQLCQLLGITEREIEVLRYIMQGYGNREVGRLLTISGQTVKNHITRINKRFHTRDRTESVVVALYLGLIPLSEAQDETDEQPTEAEIVVRSRKTPSEREIEILHYVMRGYSNKEIGRLLKISDQTVKNHIASVIDKLAARSRTGAVVVALRLGLLHFPTDLVQQEVVKTVLHLQSESNSSAEIAPSEALSAAERGAA
jgi:DNA-binding NarL/FixJ family response regulator